MGTPSWGMKKVETIGNERPVGAIIHDSVGKCDFRRDVLLFLSTKGGWYAPPGRKKALPEWGLSPLFEFPNRVIHYALVAVNDIQGVMMHIEQ